jgi:hypothetical protein
MAKFSYRIETTVDQIVASLSFADFDQSMRFMDVLTKFILIEREPQETPVDPVNADDGNSP